MPYLARVIRSAGFEFLVLAMSLGLLLGCQRKMAITDLPYQSPESFSLTGDTITTDRWWLAFDDASLEQALDSALANNLPLQNTWYQMQEARALIGVIKSGKYPDVDLSLRSGYSVPVPDFVGGENTRLTLGSSYEVDLWGRIQAGVDAQEFRFNASINDYKTAAVSLSAEITQTWFRLKAALSQKALIQEQIETNEKVLSLIRVRFASGQVRGVDILRQRQLIEGSRAQLVDLEAQIEVLKNQLSVLMGKPPGSTELDLAPTLPTLPALPQTGIPFEVVNRRPDVQAAFNRLQAADKEVAAAVSSKYPRLNFSLNGAIRSNTIQDLLQSQAAELTGGLLLPLFYGGRLNAQIDQVEAVRNQQLTQYGQTVLTAFQEIENALVQEDKQKERLAVIEEQLDLASRAYQQLRIEYLNGTSEYLDVLTALIQEQQLERDLILAKLDLLTFRVNLYRAMAGGFKTPLEETENSKNSD